MGHEWRIRVEGVSKKFGLSLQQSMLYGLKDAVSALLGQRSGRGELRPGEFWAMKDIAFEVGRGESLGIMGPNGAGKTTLLRILSGVFPPDMGRVMMRGRVGALIAAGAGFAPMLTGRENVYVNGALLGMRKADIDRRFDEIVEFAEVGPFIDAPVKHYSSGMFVRLGFAIAALSEPDILLVDEVLAVGDLNFQKKCYDYLHRLKSQGTSIILVSHSVGAVWAVCERGIFLSGGAVTVNGTVEDAIRAYNEHGTGVSVTAVGQTTTPSGKDSIDHELPSDYGGQRGGTGDAVIESVAVIGQDAQARPAGFQFGEPIVIEAKIHIRTPIEQPIFRFTVDAAHCKFIACLDSFEQKMALASVGTGIFSLRVELAHHNFMPGRYVVNAAVCQKKFGAHLFFGFGLATFQVRHPVTQFLYAEEKAVMYLGGRFALFDEQGSVVSRSSPEEGIYAGIRQSHPV